jgi:hypothetical protein
VCNNSPAEWFCLENGSRFNGVPMPGHGVVALPIMSRKV